MSNMTPEQVEKILESNSRAIASNSQMIAETRKAAQRQIDSVYNLTAELLKDRLSVIEILRSLNEDRVTNAEHLATIAENIANISQMNLQQNDTLAKQSETLTKQNETLTKQNEILEDIAQSLKKASE